MAGSKRISNGANGGAADIAEYDPWPARAIHLLALGGLLGIAFDALMGGLNNAWTRDILRVAAAFAILAGGVVFAVTLEKLRWRWSLAFAIGAGLVVAAIFYWNGSPEGWRAGEQWQLFAALLAIAIAAPLFQSARDAGRWRTDYAPFHAYAWTNIILWGAAWAFVLVAFLLAQLLAELFGLIGIALLRDLLRESWVLAMLIGGALGGAIGLLRDRDNVLGLFRRVGMTILSVLAPLLAIGLLLFAAALPFTGLAPLWEQTQATTPILLGCVIGALILANAVIGNVPEEQAPQRALRISAMVLGAVMLPLALVAAVSTGLRIEQYGLTPERLWGLVFVIACTAIALAYLVALVMGRAQWAERLRVANVRLAIGICIGALLLATPLVNFGALSTRDQLARLARGSVAADRFDWAALAHEFGRSGRAALQRIATNGPGDQRAFARQALSSKQPWDLRERQEARRRSGEIAGKLRILPAPAALPAPLADAVAGTGLCATRACVLIWSAGSVEAIVAGQPCEKCAAGVARFKRAPKGDWQQLPAAPTREGANAPNAPREQEALAQGAVELRSVTRRQLFVGGEPVGEPFE